ncbi:MAG: ABC transporter permease, partial [Planctomycetota bacterium]
LRAVGRRATRRIEALLGPDGMIVYQGRIYRPVTEEERARPATKDVFAEGQALVQAGFGKRDELMEMLGESGLTWRGGRYYRQLPDEERAARGVHFELVERIVAVRRLAEEELASIREDHGFEITAEGRIYRVRSRLSGILELDFGQSYTYNEPVLSLIGSKMEVSIQFGLIGYLLTWIVCVPLGVFKAIKHRTFFDSVSSVVVFLGYSIPGFVLCLILLSTLAVNVDWIPLGGYKPPDIDQLGYWESVLGRVRYMMIPVAGYMVGSFAAMTILMKNSLLENLGQDYVRTAFAKGLSEKRVIFVHALRNSLIPITAGIGNALGLLFAGSFLIEKTCNIDGMGLLGYNAIIQRDYPIILGLLVFGVLIRLFGNILSDIIWAAIDPRIRFGR